MDKFLENLYQIKLSQDDIQKICPGVKIITYSELIYINDLLEFLMEHDNKIIVFYQTESANNGHWTCLINHGQSVEFFDPYGYDLQTLFSRSPYLHKQIRNDVMSYHLNYIQNTYKKQIIINTVRFQKRNDDDINTCGRHTCVRLRFSFLSLQEYTRLFDYKHGDTIVSLLTSLYSSDRELERYTKSLQ